MTYIFAALKMFGFTINCLWIMTFQPFVLALTKTRGAYFLPYVWMNIWRMLFGIKIKVIGQPCRDRQVLFMGNHISYLDIPVVASVVKASFVAKSEVGQWPIAGFLSSLQQTAYIQRKRSKIAKEKASLQERIDKGESLIIFPEGTSTSGFEVLPFKSSLFMLALGENNDDLYVQPFTVKIIDVDGKAPENKTERDIYAWPRDDDIELGKHLWRIAKTSGATIELTFHEPLKASAYDNRKTLAKDCHEIVAQGLEVPKAA